MNVILLLVLIFFIPLLLFVAYLILSSCLGDQLRARITAFASDRRQAGYGRAYARNMATSTPQGGWESIELQNTYGDPDLEYDSDK